MVKKRENTTAEKTTVVEDRRNQEEDGAPEVLFERREEFLLETRRFDPDTPPVQIGLTLGMTKNLGDYQSARMDIHVTASCLPHEMEEYFERIAAWIEKKIGQEIRDIDERFVESGRRRRRR